MPPPHTLTHAHTDTAGQERLRTVGSGLLRGADAVVVTFSVAERAALEQLPGRLAFARERPGACAALCCGVVGCGGAAARAVTAAEAQAVCAAAGVDYMEATLNENDGSVEDVLAAVARRVLARGPPTNQGGSRNNNA